MSHKVYNKYKIKWRKSGYYYLNMAFTCDSLLYCIRFYISRSVTIVAESRAFEMANCFTWSYINLQSRWICWGIRFWYVLCSHDYHDNFDFGLWCRCVQGVLLIANLLYDTFADYCFFESYPSRFWDTFQFYIKNYIPSMSIGWFSTRRMEY